MLTVAAMAQLLSTAQAQVQAAFMANYYSDTNCQNIPRPTIVTDIGTGVSSPAIVTGQLGGFGSIIVTQTSPNIQAMFLCALGCECFADGCDTIEVQSGWICTNTCVSTISEVDGNGNPIFPNTQFDKFSVILRERVLGVDGGEHRKDILCLIHELLPDRVQKRQSFALWHGRLMHVCVLCKMIRYRVVCIPR